MATFKELIINPAFKPTKELSALIGKDTVIDFWKELIIYVVPDSSVQAYHYTVFDSVVMMHHYVGENEFELYHNGMFSGSANILRIIEFFEAAGVSFE